MSPTIPLLFGLLLLGAGTAHAQQSIYINAVDVTGRDLNELQMTNVDEVFFDADNNVHVVAPSYQIQMASGSVRCDPDAMEVLAGSRYFLVTMPPPDGTVADSIRVTVNGNEIDTFAPDSPQTVVDVTEFLRIGDNEIVFSAEPQVGMARSGSTDDLFRIIMGPGTRESGAIRFERTSADFSRDGSDSAVAEEMTVEFRVQRSGN